MKKGIIIWLVALFWVVLVWCGGQTPVPTSTAPWNGSWPANEVWTIKLWVIAPLSWPAASYGSDVMQWYKVAADIINSNWWVDWKEIELIIEDWKCSGKDATSAIQKLINVDKVVAILWWTCSWETIPAGKIAQSMWVPMVSATSSSPEISTIGDYVFRYWNDADAWVVMLDTFKKDWVENIALIYEGTDYAAAYADVVRSNFDWELFIDTKFDSNENDFTIIAKSVGDKINDIDALVFIPQTEANTISFIKALEDEGDWDTLRSKFMWTETVVTETTIAELWWLIDGIRGVRFPTTEAFGQETVNLVNTLTEWYEVLSAEIFTVFAADSVDVLADAIAEVGTDGEAIQQYLAWINETNTRSEYVPNFYFNESGDGQWIPFALVTIADGEIVNVE